MKTLRERILEGLASLRQSAPQMTAEEQAELARVEAAAKGETPQNTDADKGKETTPAATVTVQPSADVQALLETVKTQGQQIATLTATVTAQQSSAQMAKDEARVDTLVRSMKMTPAEATTWKKLAKDNPAAFSAAFATQESRPVLTQLRGGNPIKAQTEMSGDPGAELRHFSEARAKDKNITLGEAAKQIAAERPDLAQAHATNAPSFVVGGEGN